MSGKHMIEVQQIGDQYEATVAGIGAKVTGATLDAVLTEAQRAIVASMIAEAEKQKKRKRGKGHTVA